MRIKLDRIREEYGVECADNVRKLIHGTLDPMTYSDVESWVRQCYSTPSDDELIMCAINQELGLLGVEALRREGAWVDSYYGDITHSFCNTGDSYGLTIILDHKTGRFSQGCWADRVGR